MKKLIKALGIFFLLLILFVFGIIFLRPSEIISKEDAKRELSSPYSHFLRWRGAEIHYTDEGSGYPVMMIHGFGGSYTNFNQITKLMKDKYRIIRVDLPGFGLSDFPQVNTHEDYINDYRAYISFMLDTLHLDSLYVIGNSMGGGVAWMMAADHPDKVKKLILLDAAGYDIKNVAGKLLMFRFKSVRSIFDKGMPLFLSKSGMEHGYADNSKIDPAVVALNNKFTNREGNIQHMLKLALSSEFPDSTLITKVECPTLIIWGKEDKIIPLAHAEKFNRDIKNSRVIIYSPCGHMPMMELPKRTATDVEKFFEE